MGKNHFAKLFDLGNYQVLVQVEYDTDRNIHTITKSTTINGHMMSVTISSKIKGYITKTFAEYDKEKAQQFLEMSQLINQSSH